MRDVFYDFSWTVAARYEWRDWKDDAGKPVVPPTQGVASTESATAVELLWNRSQNTGRTYGPVLASIIGAGAEPRQYHPMHREHSALFREFADLDYRDLSSILEFARRYGALGVAARSQPPKYRGDDGERHDHAHGESYLDWSLEICLMREGRRLVGRKLSFEVSRRLTWLFDRHLQHVRGRLTFTGAGEPKLAVEPLSLIAAMWLQLALEITGDKQFVACKFCARIFEISTESSGFRSHRKFCSDSCKTKDYRKRRRTALRLGASGGGVRDIAAKTSTDATTVRSWIVAANAARRGAKTRRT